MDNDQIISALEKMRRGLYHKEYNYMPVRYREIALQLQHLITSLSEPEVEVNPVTDEESVPF